MKFVSLVLVVSASCAAVFGCDSNMDNNEAPELSAEDQQVMANMEAGTLAEITTEDGSKILFVEVAPGEVIIEKNFAIGGTVPQVEGENEMTLDQIFKAYAPTREVPSALYEAMDRVIDAEIAAADTTESEIVVEDSFAGEPIEDITVNENGIATSSDALTSSIDQSWFVNNLCGFSGVSYSWCFTSAWNGAYGTKKTHRNNAVMCGDTGAARMRTTVSGSTRTLLDIPYGQCWIQGFYHHSHNWLGSANKATITVSVDWAEASVRFSGYFVDNDRFISAPY